MARRKETEKATKKQKEETVLRYAATIGRVVATDAVRRDAEQRGIPVELAVIYDLGELRDLRRWRADLERAERRLERRWRPVTLATLERLAEERAETG